MTKLTALTCPQCQAPVRNADRCEYCGSVFRICGDYELPGDNVSIGFPANVVVNGGPYADGEEWMAAYDRVMARNPHQTFDEAIQDMQSQVDCIKETIGNALMPFLEPVVKKLMRIADNAA